MNLTITEKTENKLLNRTMVNGKIEFEQATPRNDQLAAALAKELKKDIDLVVIKNIHTEFGQKKASFRALVYEFQEAKKQLEKMTKHLKKKLAEGAGKKEETPAAEKPEEKKKLEKKEEGE